MSLPTFVRVCEMGPRDGLQNEHAVISADDKVRYIDLLSESGQIGRASCRERV